MGRQLSAEWSAVHEGLRRLRVYSCRWVGRGSFWLLVSVSLCSSITTTGLRLHVRARSAKQRGFHERCVCVCVCCFLAERLGWTSMSTYRPLASFLAMCVMDGLVLAQEDS